MDTFIMSLMRKYLQKLYGFYRCFYGRKMDFNNPQTFSEKMQWMKVYYHNPLLTKMVDKYEVKQYVIDKIWRGACNSMSRSME